MTLNGERLPFVLAFGDSLTAGYGLARADSFAAQLQHRLQAEWPGARVRNAGVSGDTTTDALARLPRLLSSLSQRPDLTIVQFGANDLLRGHPLELTRANLDAVLRYLERCGIPVLLAQMEPPALLGPIGKVCAAIYSELAAKHGVALHPFFPPGVLGNPSLTLRDRLHPTARAVGLVADHMLPAVATALRWISARAAA